MSRAQAVAGPELEELAGARVCPLPAVAELGCSNSEGSSTSTQVLSAPHALAGEELEDSPTGRKRASAIGVSFPRWESPRSHDGAMSLETRKSVASLPVLGKRLSRRYV